MEHGVPMRPQAAGTLYIGSRLRRGSLFSGEKGRKERRGFAPDLVEGVQFVGLVGFVLPGLRPCDDTPSTARLPAGRAGT